MNIIKELFHSEKRKLVDSELRRIFQLYVSNHSLRENLLYHFCLDSNKTISTLAHSKRLRAYLCLLFGEERGYKCELILPLAITVELIHNATLIVDDIQDNDIIRCGRIALWKKVGISQAMNVAFFLACMAPTYYQKKRHEISLYDYTNDLLVHLDNLFCGQQLDITFKQNKNCNIEAYQEMVDGKTGSLLVLSCLMGSFPRNQNLKEVAIIKDFALILARLHQLQDDVDELIQPLQKNEKVYVSGGNIANCWLSDVQSDLNLLSQEQFLLIFDKIINYKKHLQTQLDNVFENLYTSNIIKTDKLKFIVDAIISRNKEVLTINKIGSIEYVS